MADDDDRLFFLIVDDCPGRFDEFCKMLDHRRARWAITHDAPMVDFLLHQADILILDHDMPGADGRTRAAELRTRFVERTSPPRSNSIPTIIVSTTGIDGAVAEMRRILVDAGCPVYVCPADHHGCEAEWYHWALGAYETARAYRAGRASR